MPRAFLIHQKTKAKKAKADSSTDHSPEKEEAVEEMRELDPVQGYDGDVEEEDYSERQTSIYPAYQFLRKTMGVADKEITCLPGNPPAEKPPKPIYSPFPGQNVVCPLGDNRAGARQYVPSTLNNGYQLHSSDRPTKPEQIHLSGVKVEPNENSEINSVKEEAISPCNDNNNGMHASTSVNHTSARGEQSKYSKSTGTKRAFSNCYGILEPLNYSQQGLSFNKRARYEVEENSPVIRQADTSDQQKGQDSDKGVMNKTLAINSRCSTNNNKIHSIKGSTDVTQVQQTPLPTFNTCFQQVNDGRNKVKMNNKLVDNRDQQQPIKQSVQDEFYKPQKKHITRYTVEELTKSDVKVHTKDQPERLLHKVQEPKQSRRSSSRPFLPHPYWSPLKIEVPQFEPSPLKMTSYLTPANGGGGQQFTRGGGGSRYQMSSSPVSSDMSPPSLPESPLNGAEEELARRLSDSDRSERDIMSDGSSPAGQEVFQNQEDTSSDECGESIPKGTQFWLKKKRNPKDSGKKKKGLVGPMQQQYLHHQVTPEVRHSPAVGEEQKPRPGGLKLNDPYFWQNNIPNLPMDFKMSPFSASPLEQMRDYPYFTLPHYLNYLSALEKGGVVLPFVHPMWRPPTPADAFPHHPYLVNPAFMEARYLQYQAERLKCESPTTVYNNKKHHLTPTTPTTTPSYKDSREMAVTINEHIYLNERPISLESAASDKLSTISEDSTGLMDNTVKGSSKVSNNNNNTHISSKSATKHNCEWCGKSYSTFSGLAKHKQFHCSKQIVKQFNCQHCDKEYTSLGALKMHIRTHTLPCKCHICGKAFSRPWLLQGHIRTHTGEKPFSCQHCSRAFADRSNLRAHLQTHSDVKKYSCEQCQKTFSRMSLLIKHKDSGCTVLSVV